MGSERRRWGRAAVVAVVVLGTSAAGVTSDRPKAAPAGRVASPQASRAAVPPGRTESFDTTAYCTGRITRSGAVVKEGMAAADPKILPLGSTIRVDGQGRAYDGIYTVTDTGARVRGRELDLYLDDCDEADAFGRRQMEVTVIRRGWDPKATAANERDGTR